MGIWDMITWRWCLRGLSASASGHWWAVVGEPDLKVLDVLERYRVEPLQLFEKVFLQLKQRVCPIKPAIYV